MTHDLQLTQEEYQSVVESIKHHFFSVAKPATPAEIKAWEDGAKKSYLKEVKIRTHSCYYADRDIVIPPLYGAGSVSVIVASGVRVFADRRSHNEIYYMDGFRTEAHV